MHLCADCRFVAYRPAPQLFSPSQLVRPGIREVFRKWDANRKASQLREVDLVRRLHTESDSFAMNYEPMFHDWCAYYTVRWQDHSIHDLRGKTSFRFFPCDVVNSAGDCQFWQPMSSSSNSRAKCDKNGALLDATRYLSENPPDQNIGSKDSIKETPTNDTGEVSI
jgi:hypothetical protein